jgi:sugar phosphate isomerase/epimerase
MRVAGQAALAAAIARPDAARAGSQERQGPAPARSPSFCFFSKHLPDLGWAELGSAVKDAGFDGVDLTVRARGHVLPESAARDLPRALDAIKAAGVTVPMVTTELTSAADPAARPLLTAAARGGVRYFKTGYWHYTAGDVRAQVAATGKALEGLAALARDCGIELGFHNHTAYVGAAIWDIAPFIDRLDPKVAGYYFDPRHAMAEGGGGAWKAAAALVAPRLKMVALKDFLWEKTPAGWRIENCPLGEGMVPWKAMTEALRGADFNGPVSLHFEYEIPGATAKERTDRTLAAAVKDLAFARKVWRQPDSPAAGSRSPGGPR